MRHEDDFYDVTLVGDDQQQISAHRLVLSSCSEYFKNILKQNKHPHPLLCMEGINFNEMNSILNYIYFGEVNIDQDDLDRFLSVAQRLKLEGLISHVGEPIFKRQRDDYQIHTREDRNALYPENDGVDVQQRSNIIFQSTKYDRNVLASENEEIVLQQQRSKLNVDSTEYECIEEKQRSKIIVDSTEFESIEELDAKIFEYIEKEDNGKWKCIICKQKSKSKKDVKEHVEVHIDGLSFPCPDCDSKLR